MKKIKIIEISHSSESYSLGEGEKELKKLVINDWPARVSKQIKKFYPEIEVECWAPEKIYKEEKRFQEFGVLFKFFPTTFALRYAMDFSIPMIKELKKEVEKSKKENYKLIIHFHEIHNIHGLTIATLFKNENVIVQHHGGSNPMKHLKGARMKKFLFPLLLFGQLWENKVLKNIKYYYTLSDYEKIYLKKTAPNSRLKFQTMGIEEEYFKNTDKKVARIKLKLPKDKKIILFIGKVDRIKGMDLLLEAMKDLRDIELKIIGFGPQEPIFKKYVKENNLDNVEFLGGVFGEKKMLYLSSADAFVLPSRREGAPVTVMEALSRNTPVVVSDVGGVKLMIENNREGIIIRQNNVKDIVNALRKILRWKKKNVRQYARKYEWKKIIDETVRDYNEIK
ncbi:MAG: glycosyltransferase family 4 protein [Nanoarchaeota archaeon]|nr:glycosyltransferase family 4 protein [Nanoarchaeota archaeon]